MHCPGPFSEPVPSVLVVSEIGHHLFILDPRQETVQEYTYNHLMRGLKFKII